MKSKAQAAITDALFFMMIVAGLGTTLFIFTATFGHDVSRFIEQSYESTYATSALKTILYSNTSRYLDSTNNIIPISDTEEADFLMTLIKEDYANLETSESYDVQKVSSIALIKTIDDIMKPINPANDYLIYIRSSESADIFSYPFVYIKFFDIVDVDNLSNPSNREKGFFCIPTENIDDDLSRFILKTQPTGRSIVPIELRKINSEGNGDYSLKTDEKAQIGLIIWRSTPNITEASLDWNCEEISES